MNTFDYVEELWSLFTANEELKDLLGIDDDEDYAIKIRTEDVMAEGYEVDKLPFITIYFSEAWVTENDFMNQGYLCIDIYAAMRNEVPEIRKIIVDTMHNHFDERVRNEGQQQSGIHAVYKYHLEFRPLVFT
jgi:hypothetical protein